MSNVRSAPLVNGESAKNKTPQIGFVSGSAIERVFIAGLYVALALLALLSVFGTFYGMRGAPAPLAEPWLMVVAAAAAPVAAGWSALLQMALSLTQWGARQRARRNPRWWLLYLAVLTPSVYYNFVAYFDPAVALGVPWLIALLLIVSGDVIPELVAVRQD